MWVKLAFRLLFGVSSNRIPALLVWGLKPPIYSLVFYLLSTSAAASSSYYFFNLFSISFLNRFFDLLAFSSFSRCYFLNYSNLWISSPNSSTSLLKSLFYSSSSSFESHLLWFGSPRSLKTLSSWYLELRMRGVIPEKSGSVNNNHSVVYFPRNYGKFNEKKALIASNSSLEHNFSLR